MQVKEVMSSSVDLVSPETTVVQAAQKMRASNIGILPVCNGNKLVGVLTDRDIVVRAVAGGSDLSATLVKDTMSKGLDWCFDDQSLKEAADKMTQNHIHRLPVISRDKKLVGIISLSDIAARGEPAIACEAVEKISQAPRDKV